MPSGVPGRSVDNAVDGEWVVRIEAMERKE